MRNCLVYYADVRELERYTNVTIDLESRIYSSSKCNELGGDMVSLAQNPQDNYTVMYYYSNY